MGEQQSYWSEYREQEYRSMARKSQSISDLLRDGYDDAVKTSKGEAFSVHLYLSDLPYELSAQDKKRFENGRAAEVLERLFGIIAMRASVSIDRVDNTFVVSLNQDAKPDTK